MRIKHVREIPIWLFPGALNIGGVRYKNFAIFDQ